MPAVSVIVPSFNQGAFIGHTLDSILGQDFADLECLVMDGGSTDETVGVLHRYSDPRLIWVSEPDRGQSHAINKGLARAQGQVLTYLNSDDLLAPGAVASAVTYFEAQPEADLIEGDLNFIDAGGAVIGMLPGRPFLLAELLSGRHRFNQAGAFWRSSLTRRIGLMDEGLHYTMDHDYWARAALAGAQIVYVPGVRASFRLHEG
ncbi:MAG TPA: glycosyltransferase family 2 protein, partial [Candidatus Limnocylindrales bacterium]|nr:glycosyltransferase family 2 protein [Candidatus Limnocylindrales bacterium]